jgi:hypothetical protein
VIARRHYLAVGTVIAAASLASVSLTGCQPADNGSSAEADSEAGTEAATAHLVEVIARDYAFDAPDEIPSGWTTFRLKNEGKEHHFLLLQHLPEGKTLEAYIDEIGQPFDSVWHELQGGLDKAEAGALLGQLLPEWWASVKQMGGPGFVAPGGVAETSVKLEPGTYVMECYVKTADGKFHGMLGMTRELTVTEEDSGAPEPEADLAIGLSSFEMAIDGDMTAGEQTVAVHFQEHPEFSLGNDVHVVRLDDDTDLNEVIAWMDWMNLEGLRAPAPAAFLGGAHEMPVGHTSYFTVDLAPGRYAWIAESAADKGMVREFAID